MDRVPVSPLALHPKLGGPKNLPVASVTLEDEASEENRKLASKPKLIIVGGGWGVSGSLDACFTTDKSPGHWHPENPPTWGLPRHGRISGNI